MFWTRETRSNVFSGRYGTYIQTVVWICVDTEIRCVNKQRSGGTMFLRSIALQINCFADQLLRRPISR